MDIENNNSNLLKILAILNDLIIKNKTSLDLLKSVFETLPDGVVVINNEGNIIVINTQTELLFGYHRNELLGNKIEMLLPERFKDKHENIDRKDYITHPRIRALGYNLPLYGLCKNGNEFEVEIQLVPIPTIEGPCVAAIVRPIGEINGMSKEQQEDS